MNVRTPQYLSVSSDEQLADYCRRLADAPSIAFDTEFVAENTFRPILCLIQVFANGEAAIIDPLSINDLRPFWEVLVQPGHETVVHSGRGEIEFCLQAIGRPPAALFDVQLAAGLIGVEYPAGYGTLLAKLLDSPLKKHETRTDWRRRPLSSRQIEYAVDDVRFLPRLRDALFNRLSELKRLEWLAEEMQSWLDEVQRSLSEERWTRLAGNASLDGRGLAIVRELWRWRQAEAERTNHQPRKVLRDDLLIEMAKRQTADAKQIQAVRGMEWSRVARQLPQIVKCVERGLQTPEADRPTLPPRDLPPQLAVLGQFLSAALGSICRHAHLAPTLVGTPSDVRDLILYRLGGRTSPTEPPLLARGWRAEVVGRLFEDLLAGKKAVRINNPRAAHPLVIEDFPPLS